MSNDLDLFEIWFNERIKDALTDRCEDVVAIKYYMETAYLKGVIDGLKEEEG